METVQKNNTMKTITLFRIGSVFILLATILLLAFLALNDWSMEPTNKLSKEMYTQAIGTIILFYTFGWITYLLPLHVLYKRLIEKYG